MCSSQPRNPHDDKLVLSKHDAIFPDDNEVSHGSVLCVVGLFPLVAVVAGCKQCGG